MKKLVLIFCMIVLMAGFTACKDKTVPDSRETEENAESGSGQAQPINIYEAETVRAELTAAEDKEAALQVVKKDLFQVDEYEEAFTPLLYIFTWHGSGMGYEMVAYNAKREAIAQGADGSYLKIYTNADEKYVLNLNNEEISVGNPRTDIAQMVYDMFNGVQADEFAVYHVIPADLEKDGEYIYREDLYELQFTNQAFFEKYKNFITGVDLGNAVITLRLHPSESELATATLADTDGNEKRLFTLRLFASTDDWSLQEGFYGGQLSYDEALAEINGVLKTINRSTVQVDDRYSGFAMMPYDLEDAASEGESEGFHAATTGQSVQMDAKIAYTYCRNGLVGYGKYIGTGEEYASVLYPNTDHEVVEIEYDPMVVRIYMTEGYAYSGTSVYDSNREELLLSKQQPDVFSFIGHVLEEKREGYLYSTDNEGRFLIEITGKEAVRELYSYWGEAYEQEEYGKLLEMVKDDEWIPTVKLDITLRDNCVVASYIAVNGSEEIPVWSISPMVSLTKDWRLDDWWYTDGAEMTDRNMAEAYFEGEVQKVSDLILQAE